MTTDPTTDLYPTKARRRLLDVRLALRPPRPS